MASEVLEDKIAGLLEPVLEDGGFELVDLAFVPEHGHRILRLFVDRAEGGESADSIGGGITIDEIALLSRDIGTLLDVEDLIAESYSLEVSSPGLDRPLTKPAHFARAVGKAVKIRTKVSIEGRKNFKGTIESFQGNTVRLVDADGKSFEISIDDIDKARLEVVI